MNESCMELTAPQDVTVVTTENHAEGTIPNRTSFPSMFPPGWRARGSWSIPRGVNAGFPPSSDQIAIPASGRKMMVMAIRRAMPLRPEPIIFPNV